jgi:hypothetical protein
VPVSIFVIGFLLWPGETATGGGLARFMIFSAMPLGFLPVLTLVNMALTTRINGTFFAGLFCLSGARS